MLKMNFLTEIITYPHADGNYFYAWNTWIYELFSDGCPRISILWRHNPERVIRTRCSVAQDVPDAR